MPKRKATAKRRRVSEQVIEGLREMVRNGAPWQGEKSPGWADLYGLVRGHFYGIALQHCAEDDEESQRALWVELKTDILREHINRAPCTRPAAWWRWDAPELRRIVGRHCLEPEHDDDCEGDHHDGRPPAFEDPSLQGIVHNYFGAPSVYDGYVYKIECDFLERLNLLLPEEKAIFDKFGSVINVRVQPGESGKCAPCWERARETAKKIDFDLEAAIQRYKFWIPGDLYVECEHHQYNGSCGIFVDAQ